MSSKLRLLLAGRSKDALVDLQNQLSPRSRLDVELRHIENGHADPLYGLAEMPDLLILHIAGLEGGELDALLERPTAARPPMIVVSASGKPAAMRLAMSRGKRFFAAVREAGNLEGCRFGLR